MGAGALYAEYEAMVEFKKLPSIVIFFEENE